MRAGGLEEGGSTLTQQLARTLFLTASRGDWTRKGKEAVLALMIEQRLSKPQILEFYLNRIYLGGNVYGVEAMSQNVFGKSAFDLTLPEAAFIAGLIRMPSALWPWSHYDRAVERSHVVLARMREEGLITAQAEQQARAAPPRILADPGLNRGAAGYAQDYLRQQFKAAFEDDNPPDWKVRTTFVPALQREAERAVTQGLAKFRQAGLQAALVVIDPQTGDVLAMVGRARLPAHAVQPRDWREASAGLGVQAISSTRPRSKAACPPFRRSPTSAACACPATTSGKSRMRARTHATR